MAPLPDNPPYAWHDPGLFYQGNSGFHAIQLAFKMRARTLVILGVDARASGYMLPAWDAKPKDDFTFVVHLTRLLSPELADVRVIYGSPEGTLPFPRTTPEEALAALGV